MAILSIFLALIAGALQPFQAAINSRLGKEVDNPIFSVFVSGLLGAAVLGVYLLFTRQVLPKGWVAATHVPWWMWLGGVIGAAYLTTIVLATAKLGSGASMALVIAAQVAVSVVLDHFAAFGLDKHPLNIARVAGVLFFCVGAFLIGKF